MRNLEGFHKVRPAAPAPAAREKDDGADLEDGEDELVIEWSPIRTRQRLAPNYAQIHTFGREGAIQELGEVNGEPAQDFALETGSDTYDPGNYEREAEDETALRLIVDESIRGDLLREGQTEDSSDEQSSEASDSQTSILSESEEESEGSYDGDSDQIDEEEFPQLEDPEAANEPIVPHIFGPQTQSSNLTLPAQVHMLSTHLHSSGTSLVANTSPILPNSLLRPPQIAAPAVPIAHIEV